MSPLEDPYSNGGSGRKTGHLIITDVGSTTTKALLLSREEDGSLRIRASANVPTTVEKPFEDVCRGVASAVSQLETRSGEKLSKNRGMPGVPYLSTSSAGGGLQMLVFGLTSIETGRIAEVTASNAGGVVLRVISIDDELQAVEKMQVIQDLHPDMIMLAGGTDGGAIAGVVRLSEILAISNPQPKFRQDMNIPLVYCGNRDAIPFIDDILSEKFDLHIVENVRPSMQELNMDPAREEIHRLFMDNVMERAPGYSELKSYTVSDILPTPAGVENILRLYSSRSGENVLMVDMGGATTDIFSSIAGDYNRTVAANTGMSYSISNILKRCGMGGIRRHLPSSFDIGEIRNYIYNKTINPTYTPSGPGEILLEQSAAICGMETSWTDHLSTCYQIKHLGFLDRMKALNRCMFEETFITSGQNEIKLSDIDTIIGSGGVISHAEPKRAFWMLADGFRPYGITSLAIDRDFRSPHLGVLSEIEETAAMEMFTGQCLEKLGWVVAPFGDFGEGNRVMSIRNLDSGEVTVLDYGDIHFLESGGNLRFELEKSSSLGDCDNTLVTDLPVLVDCRNRGEKASDAVLADAGIPEFSHGDIESLASGITPPEVSVEDGEWELEYRLPYSGTINVRKGQKIQPGIVLGENTYAPPRLYIIDLNKIPGYDRHLTPEEVGSGLLVKEGDRISLNTALYKVHRQGMTGFDFTFRSTVRGRIERIEENGLIIVREIQDYDDKPHVVDIAGPLDIKPRHIGSWMKIKLGDFVDAGQTLASDMSKGINGIVRSPVSGIVKKIDRKKGTVTVKFDIQPVEMVSHVYGEVGEVVQDRGVTVSGSGIVISGLIGFGGETSGVLRNIAETLTPDSIVYSAQPVDREFLKNAEAAGVNGIIAPSIQADHWLGFSGEEMGVAITGDEKIPFTVILTCGFGSFMMSESCSEILSRSVGKTVCMNGRTQIRAGVTRPVIII